MGQEVLSSRQEPDFVFMSRLGTGRIVTERGLESGDARRSVPGESFVRPMNVRAVFYVPYPLRSTPSQRFRLEQWEPRMATQGIAIEFRPFATEALAKLLYRPGLRLRKGVALASAFLRHRQRLPRKGEFDVAVVHRGMSLVGPAILERRVARVLPVLYDFD